MYDTKLCKDIWWLTVAAKTGLSQKLTCDITASSTGCELTKEHLIIMTIFHHYLLP